MRQSGRTMRWRGLVGLAFARRPAPRRVTMRRRAAAVSRATPPARRATDLARTTACAAPTTSTPWSTRIFAPKAVRNRIISVSAAFFTSKNDSSPSIELLLLLFENLSAHFFFQKMAWSVDCESQEIRKKVVAFKRVVSAKSLAKLFAKVVAGSQNGVSRWWKFSRNFWRAHHFHRFRAPTKAALDQQNHQLNSSIQ